MLKHHDCTPIGYQNYDLAIIRMTAPALCEHDRHGRTRYMILNGPHTTDRYVKGWHFHLQGSRHSRSMTQTTRASLTWTLSRPSLRRNVDVRYGSFFMVRLDAGHRYFLLGLSKGQNGIDNRFWWPTRVHVRKRLDHLTGIRATWKTCASSRAVKPFWLGYSRQKWWNRRSTEIQVITCRVAEQHVLHLKKSESPTKVNFSSAKVHAPVRHLQCSEIAENTALFLPQRLKSWSHNEMRIPNDPRLEEKKLVHNGAVFCSGYECAWIFSTALAH